MKKIIALILCVILVMPVTASVAYAQKDTLNVQNLMKDLKIMQGDENGNFNLEDKVTRAEFAKIAVSTSEYRNSVAANSFTSPFHDVPFTYWGASYIRCAANSGFIKGYPDSTFRPEDSVLLEEGVTIVLKLLGYGDDYFDLSWPYGQMSAATDFELLEGVNASVGQALTRGDVMTLIYNALTTNMKDKQTTLLNSFGYSYTEDVILIATSNEDSSIAENKVLTSAGTFEIQKDFDKSLAGYKGDIITKNTGEMLSFVPTNKRGASYRLDTVLNDNILVFDGAKTLSMNIGKNASIYYKTEKTSMDALKSKASTGDNLIIYTNTSGDTEYIMVSGTKSAGAVTELTDLSDYGINSDADIRDFINNSSDTSTKDEQIEFLNAFGYSYTEDVILIATSNEDSSIAENKVLTSAGTFEIQNDFDKSLAGYKGDMITKNTGEILSFVPTNKRGTSYILNTILNEDVLVYDGAKTVSVNIGKNTSIYYKTEKTSMDALKSKASVGDSITIYTNKAGDTEYVMVGNMNSTGAVTILSDLSDYGINEETVIYKNGKTASQSEISVKDILYYSKDMNTAWVWSNKITGVYESASPNKDNISTVTVSGKTYSIETATAYEKFVTGGSLNIGDTITIHLGRNGEIADAFSVLGEDETMVGYLIETGTKQYTNELGNSYSSYYVVVAYADGSEVEYKTEIDYKDYKRNLVSVSFGENGTKIEKVPTGNNILAGEFNTTLNLLGNAKIASDIRIMDVIDTGSAGIPVYTVLHKQRIDKVNISKNNILYYQTNEKGEISELYLDNLTNDGYNFGIVTDGKVINCGGANYSATSSATGLNRGRAVKAITTDAGSKAYNILSLYQVKEAFSSATDTSLVFGDTEYKVYDKIAVYERVAVGKWQSVTYADFLRGDKPESVMAYYDKTEANGGRIRVLVITR